MKKSFPGRHFFRVTKFTGAFWKKKFISGGIFSGSQNIQDAFFPGFLGPEQIHQIKSQHKFLTFYERTLNFAKSSQSICVVCTNLYAHIFIHFRQLVKKLLGEKYNNPFFMFHCYYFYSRFHFTLEGQLDQHYDTQSHTM